MRQPVLSLAVTCALLLAPLVLRTPSAQPAAATVAPSARVIVKYKADSALLPRTIQAVGRTDVVALQAARAQALGQRIGMAVAAGAGIAERTQVVLAEGISSEQLAARIASESDVEYAVPDLMRRATAVPNDTFYASRPYDSPSAPAAGGPLVGQWYLKPPGPATSSPTASTSNTGPAAINAQGAWDITTGSSSIVVAVLDTGVRYDHSDLAANLLPGYDMVSQDSDGTFTTSNDGDGRDADASDPGDFVVQANVGHGGCRQSDVGDTSSWHGTETSGLIAAVTDNGIGVASVGRNVRVLPVRVLGRCGGYDSDIMAGILWASGIAVPGLPANPNKARVINMSLGGAGTCSQAYVDAIAQANAQGTVVVAAAGNTEGRAVGTPANCAGVIAVAGLRHIGTKVGFSDLGPQIAISAPGGNCVNTTPGAPCLYSILTTTNSGTTTPVSHAAGGSIYSDSFSRRVLGTSFSAPLVAGTAALMLSAQPQLTPAEVRTKMQATARAFPNAPSDETGAPVPVCAAPTTVNQDQCVCTTALCGAGMLDAQASVLSAAGVQARIAATSSQVAPGQPVTLDASASLVPAGHSITAYQWTLTNGGGIVSALTGATNGATVSATPTGDGTFTVALQVTDNTGVTSTTAAAVSVQGGVVSTPAPGASGSGGSSAPSSSGGGGGGGGALGAGWLLLLAGAIVALRIGAARQRG